MIGLSEKYEPLFNRPEGVDTFIVTGGRFSAKSFAVSLAACHWAASLKHRILYTRYTNVSGKDSTLPEFEEKIDLLGYNDLFKVSQNKIECVNGAKIVFKGLKAGSGNQTANMKSMKDFSAWILEEAEELDDYDVFLKTALSVRGNSPKNKEPNIKVLILNPTTKTHWIYEEFFTNMGVKDGFNGVKDNVCYIHTSYLDCKEHVPDDIFRMFEKLKRVNPDKYKHVVEGGWLEKAEGVVFNNWETGEFDDSLPFIYAQDYGFADDPTTLIKVAVDSKRNKVYVKELFFKFGLNTNQIIEYNKALTVKGGLIVADSAEPRLISELKQAGLNMKRSKKGRDSVRAGIKKLQDYKIIVDPKSFNLQKELNNYCWSDKRSETPVDMYNHCIDPLRYAIQEQPSNKIMIKW